MAVPRAAQGSLGAPRPELKPNPRGWDLEPFLQESVTLGATISGPKVAQLLCCWLNWESSA